MNRRINLDSLAIVIIIISFVVLHFPIEGLSLLWLGYLGFIVVGAYCCHQAKGSRQKSAVCFAFIFMVAVLAHLHWQIRSTIDQQNQLASIAGKHPIQLEITKIIQQQSHYQTVLAIADFTHLNLGKAKIYLNWQGEQSMQLGDIVQGDLTLKPLASRLNFGGFDRQNWLITQGVVATGNMRNVTKVSEKKSFRHKLLYRALEQTKALDSQGLLIALGFGERAWLSAEQWQLYQKTGTAHLIAISGLHIGLAMLLGWGMARLVQWFLPIRYIHPYFPQGVGILLALGYSLLAGFSIPTFRAIMALTLLLVFQLARLHLTVWQRFIRVVALLVIMEPFALLSTSFWLSFGAVFSLILWYQVCPLSLFYWRSTPITQTSLRWLMGIIHLQLGLLVIFTPIQLWIFGGLPSLGFFANLVSVPFYSFLIVPCVLCSILTQNLFSTWQGGDYLIHLADRYLSVLPNQWMVFSLSQQYSIIFFCSLLVLLIYILFQKSHLVSQSTWERAFLKPQPKLFSLQLNGYQKIPGLYWGVGIVILLCMGQLGYRQYKSHLPQMHLFDVAHGLSVLFTYQNKGLLYDTGMSWQNGSMAQLEIIPYLQREGIELEQIILSHDDNDHIGGVPDLVKAYPNVTVFSTSLRSYHTQQQPCLKGQQWQWRSLNLQAFEPSKLEKVAKNEHSCVILVELEGFRILLTGDTYQKNEFQFARQVGKIDILHIGHHGSKTSTSWYLLQQTQPEIALISAGRFSPWHHPHPQTIDRLEKLKIPWLNTAQHGQVQFVFQASEYKIYTARHRFSPWFRRFIGE